MAGNLQTQLQKETKLNNTVAHNCTSKWTQTDTLVKVGHFKWSKPPGGSLIFFSYFNVFYWVTNRYVFHRTQVKITNGLCVMGLWMLCGLRTWTQCWMTIRCCVWPTVRGSNSTIPCTCCLRCRTWLLLLLLQSADVVWFTWIPVHWAGDHMWSRGWNEHARKWRMRQRCCLPSFSSSSWF